jgi:AraC-like DNA-binding protein
MTGWTERLCLTADDPSLPCSELTAGIQLALEERADRRVLYDRIGLTRAELEDPATRVSIRQQYAASCVIAAACAPGFSFRLARRMRLTAYGIAGYALLSSPSLNQALNIAEACSPLLNLKFHLSVRMERGMACIGFRQRYTMDDDMRVQCLQFELVKLKTLLDDVMCEPMPVRELACRPSIQEALKDLRTVMRVPTLIEPRLPEGVLAEIRCDECRLHAALPQAHAATHAACTRVCDALMADIAIQHDLARRVRDVLRKSTGKPPTLPDLAKTLCMSQRTLRRRLEALNTSYSLLLDEVRKELAIGYVTSTRYTTGVIADLLGYSDAANFRHAFKRWTGVSPRNHSGGFVLVKGDPDRDRVRATRATRPSLRLHQVPKLVTHEGALNVAVAAWRRAA